MTTHSQAIKHIYFGVCSKPVKKFSLAQSHYTVALVSTYGKVSQSYILYTHTSTFWDCFPIWSLRVLSRAPCAGNSNVEHLFIYVAGHLYAFFRKCLYRSSARFPNQGYLFQVRYGVAWVPIYFGYYPHQIYFVDFFSTPFFCLFIILSPWLFKILYTSA